MSQVPLSDDRLDEIRALAIDMEAMRTDIIHPFVSTPQPRPPILQALMDVLAEVDRQRAVSARDQWRAIGRSVCDEAVVELLGLDICAFCGGFVEGTEDLLGPVQHSDWCPVTRIRALLDDGEVTP